MRPAERRHHDVTTYPVYRNDQTNLLLGSVTHSPTRWITHPTSLSVDLHQYGKVACPCVIFIPVHLIRFLRQALGSGIGSSLARLSDALLLFHVSIVQCSKACAPEQSVDSLFIKKIIFTVTCKSNMTVSRSTGSDDGSALNYVRVRVEISGHVRLTSSVNSSRASPMQSRGQRSHVHPPRKICGTSRIGFPMIITCGLGNTQHRNVHVMGVL